MTRSRRQRGQALTEFALVAPFLFLVLLAIVEAARFIYYSETLSSATREGARYAIVHGNEATACSGPSSTGRACDTTKVADTVRNFALGVIRDGDFVIDVCYPGGFGADPVTPTGAACQVNNDPGSFVRVTLDYRYKLLIPFVPLPEVPLHAQTILVINH